MSEQKPSRYPATDDFMETEIISHEAFKGVLQLIGTIKELTGHMESIVLNELDKYNKYDIYLTQKRTEFLMDLNRKLDEVYETVNNYPKWIHENTRPDVVLMLGDYERVFGETDYLPQDLIEDGEILNTIKKRLQEYYLSLSTDELLKEYENWDTVTLAWDFIFPEHASEILKNKLISAEIKKLKSDKEEEKDELPVWLKR